MENKAQIGETITWIVGFLIIFFVVVLFVIFSFILSGQKYFIYGKDSIIFNKYDINLNSQNFLMDFLDDKMESGDSVKDFLVKEKNVELVKESLKNEIENKLSKLGDCGYLFSLEYNPENLKEFKEGKSDLLYRKIDFGKVDRIDKSSEELFYEGSILSLYAQDSMVLIKFYLGECK